MPFVWPGVCSGATSRSPTRDRARRAPSRRSRRRRARRGGRAPAGRASAREPPSSATWSPWWWVSRTWVGVMPWRSAAAISGLHRPAGVDEEAARRRPRRRGRCSTGTAGASSARGPCGHPAEHRSAMGDGPELDPHLLPDRRHRPVGRLLQRARIRGDAAGMPIRDEAINVFMGLPGDGARLELTYNHGVDSYEIGTGYNHIAITADDLDATLGQARPSRASSPRSRRTRSRGRLAAVLRPRPGRLPDRAHRARLVGLLVTLRRKARDAAPPGKDADPKEYRRYFEGRGRRPAVIGARDSRWNVARGPASKGSERLGEDGAVGAARRLIARAPRVGECAKMPRRSSAQIARVTRPSASRRADQARERALAEVRDPGELLHAAVRARRRGEALEHLELAARRGRARRRASARARRRPRVVTGELVPAVEQGLVASLVLIRASTIAGARNIC